MISCPCELQLRARLQVCLGTVLTDLNVAHLSSSHTGAFLMLSMTVLLSISFFFFFLLILLQQLQLMWLWRRRGPINNLANDFAVCIIFRCFVMHGQDVFSWTRRWVLIVLSSYLSWREKSRIILPPVHICDRYCLPNAMRLLVVTSISSSSSVKWLAVAGDRYWSPMIRWSSSWCAACSIYNSHVLFSFQRP